MKTLQDRITEKSIVMDTIRKMPQDFLCDAGASNAYKRGVMDTAAGKPFNPPKAVRLEFDAYCYGAATYNAAV
jgi:hypothetical protein